MFPNILRHPNIQNHSNIQEMIRNKSDIHPRNHTWSVRHNSNNAPIQKNQRHRNKQPDLESHIGTKFVLINQYSQMEQQTNIRILVMLVFLMLSLLYIKTF